MAKNLTRPALPHPIDTLLGLTDDPPKILPLDRISLGGHNPRTLFVTDAQRAVLFSPETLADLTASIQELQADGQPRGILQPLLVRPQQHGQYELVAGERRYHAAKLAGLQDVPVLIRQLSNREVLEAAIIENAQRDDIDVVRETFAGFALMRAHTGLNTGDVVKLLNDLRLKRVEDTLGLDPLLRRVFGTGISTWSQQRARILQLQDAEQEALGRGLLDAKVLFPLIRLGELPARERLLNELLALPELPSSMEVERRVAALLNLTPDDSARRFTTFRQLMPALRRVKGDRAVQVDALLQSLKQLLEADT